MYSTCLHCTKPLGTNDVLETLPIGRRIAFDGAQGRLWVVCRHCAKWNPVPFDTRLESIDACERLYRDTTKRYSTGTIGLARARDGLDLVRIGAALRPEFAAWRYGESYRRRRRNAFIAGGVGVGIAAGTVAGVGVAIGAMGAVFAHVGWTATRVTWEYAFRRNAAFRVIDPDGAGRPRRVGYLQMKGSRLVWEEGRLTLEVPRFLTTPSSNAPMKWRGTDAMAIGRRVAGGLNLTAGTGKNIERAIQLVAEHNGDLSRWLPTRVQFTNVKTREVAPKPKPWGRWEPLESVALHDLPDDQRLGVEMWMNEDIERIWLEGELKLLEREWREAEKLARIADEMVVKGEG